jgi:integrase
MIHEKYQRPKVKASGSREKVWKAQYREYYLDSEGKQQFRHKSKTWPQAEYKTKSAAQSACDQFMAGLQSGGAHGAMTLEQFWKQVYLPIRSWNWTGQTPAAVQSTWKNHIQPQLGAAPLKDITKAMIQMRLGEMADKRLGTVTVDEARIRIKSILEEAVDNDLIPKNPARKVETPVCKPKKETRSLTPAEVRKLWDGTEGKDYLYWRLMILTGARIGEVLGLERSKILPEGLLINQIVLGPKLKLPKRNKIRTAPLPDSLRGELEEWLQTHDNKFVFPAPEGDYCRDSDRHVRAIVKRARAIIPDLEFRMCRTFATLFEGDEADRTSIMGHHDTRFTLERYRKPLEERRKKAVEKLDRKLKVVPINKRAS